MGLNLQELHKECHAILKKEFYGISEDDDDGNMSLVVSNACKVYDKLTEGGGRQDCIGENFNQLIHRLEEEWFSCYTPGQRNNLDYYFYNYFLLLYLFVERVDLIFQVINPDGKAKLFQDYHFHNFKTLRVINKWANFIKHPKEFMFTHWPKYYIQGTVNPDISETDVKIDTDFIFAHYMSDKKPAPVILENNQNVYVEIPNLKEITLKFCQEMNLFFDFICSNQVVADFLKKKSTVQYFFNYDDINLDENNDLEN